MFSDFVERTVARDLRSRLGDLVKMQPKKRRYRRKTSERPGTGLLNRHGRKPHGVQLPGLPPS